MAALGAHSWIFFTLGVVAYFGCVIDGGDAAWDRNVVTATQGDEVILSCTVQDVGPFDVARITHQFPDGTEHTVAENQRLKTDYEASGRYDLQYRDDSDAVVLTLNNSGIRGEDRGRLACYKRVEEGQPKIAYVDIDVLVPVKDVYVIAVDGDKREKIGDGGKVSLRQRVETGVICVAEIEGTNESPEMDVLVGGQTQAGLFTETSEPASISRRSSSIMDRQSATTQLAYITTAPLPEFNEQQLVCEATSPGLPTVSATITLDVAHAPIVTCPKYEYYGQVGGTVEITCEVTSNPSSNIGWYSGTSTETRSEITAESDHFITREKPISQSKAEVTLVITNLNASHFTQYYMSANNELGEDDVLIKLEEAAEPPVQPTKPPNPSNSQKNPNTQDQTDQKPAEPQTVVGDNGATSQKFHLSIVVATVLTFHHLFSIWKRQ